MKKMFNAGTLKLANLVIGLELVFLCKECTCKPGVLSYMRKSNCEQKKPYMLGMPLPTWCLILH